MNAATPADSPAEFDLLESSLRDEASCRVDFDRDETDSFSITFTPLGQTDLFLESLTKTDVLPLLPSGSHWSRVAGWRSFSGIPCQFHGTLWLALGMTEVKDHPTRGAYPVTRLYFLDFEDAPVADALGRIIEGLQDESGVNEEARPAYGAIIGDAEDPEEHRETELWILNRARAAYQRQKRLLFRTAVMSEEEIPSLRLVNFFRRNFSSSQSPYEFQQFLYSTIPSSYDLFGWQSKLKVFFEVDVAADLSLG